MPVAKVTISLPPALAAFLDREQARTGATRSELVAQALWAAQLRAREARYAAAYAAHPETADELAFTDAATEDFFGTPPSARDLNAPLRGGVPKQGKARPLRAKPKTPTAAAGASKNRRAKS
jgi:hypothetical protein